MLYNYKCHLPFDIIQERKGNEIEKKSSILKCLINYIYESCNYAQLNYLSIITFFALRVSRWTRIYALYCSTRDLWSYFISGSILALLGYKVNSLLTLSQNWFARKIRRSYENEIILKFVDMTSCLLCVASLEERLLVSDTALQSEIQELRTKVSALESKVASLESKSSMCTFIFHVSCYI